MKAFLKIAGILLVLCQLLCCFAGCKGEELPEESESATESSGEALFELTREQLTEYTIVVPRMTDEDMNAVARLLQRTIRDFCGVELEIRDDFVIEGSSDFCEEEYEILIGNTNRSETKEYYANVKRDDFGYALVGKKLLILGYTNATANSSVIEFKLDVLMNAPESGVLMTADANKVVTRLYDYDTLMINGVPISEYTIVYPNASVRGENEIASYLRDYITAKTGFVLRCENDQTEAFAHEIQIGETARITDAMKAERDGAGVTSKDVYLGKTDNGIWLSAGSKTALFAGLEKLIARIGVKENNLTLELSESVAEAVKDLSLSVMNYNVYYDLAEVKRNPDDVVTSVKQKAPDVFGLNESGMDWINKFRADAEISASYDCATGKAADNTKNASYNPIFYRKDKFDLVESGTKWLSATPDKMTMFADAAHYKIFTYVILQDKASGTQFMYINVHLDGSNESGTQEALVEVRKLQATVLKDFAASYNYLPIVIGGDFNEGPSSDVVRGMSNKTRFKYCLNVATERIDIGATKKVNSKFEPLEKGGVLDYLFATADCITVDKYEQVDNHFDGKYPSDHLPVYAEITIKY